MYTKPTSVPANQYIELLLTWVSEQLEDETVFPTEGEFGKKFLPTVKVIQNNFFRIFENTSQTILKRLARIYFHIYYVIIRF